MADLSDVTAYFRSAVTAAVYPKGTSQPSVAGVDCRIFEGWPIPNQLDLDLAGKRLVNDTVFPRPNGPVVNVSIFPLMGGTAAPYQLLDKTYTIAAPDLRLTVESDDESVTITGTPSAGEFVTILCDRANAFSATGASAAAILADLQQQAAVVYPGAAVIGSRLSVPGVYAFDVKRGGIGKLGRVVHRQKQSIMVTVWAHTPVARSAFAAPIDAALKAKNVITMPDTSQALVVFNRTNQIDEQQAATVYRRDLVFDVEYATLEIFEGTMVTSADLVISIQPTQ